MITALQDESSIDRAFDAGATDYMTKPVNLVLLRHRLQRTIAASRRQARIEYLAHYDPLTRLANRVLLLDHFHYTLALAQRTRALVGLLYFDIDRFKSINDTWGHNTGDLVLSRVGDRMANLVRSCDSAARLGGDEFVILVTAGVSDAGVKVVAQRILETVSSPLSLSEGPKSISVSVGAALYPRDGDDVPTLLERATQPCTRQNRTAGTPISSVSPASPTPPTCPVR